MERSARERFPGTFRRRRTPLGMGERTADVPPRMRIDDTAAGPSGDEAVVARVLAGGRESFEVLMRRHNQCVFRAARAVLRDDAEAEDVAQEAWVRAYSHLGQFSGRASFATWVTR